jgi:hypothetical protein
MQDYLDHHPAVRRPTYAEITSSKARSSFTEAFANTEDLLKAMKDSKSKKATTTGLWLLDVHSYHDWRNTTHVKKVYTEYIAMAHIEISVIKSYRATLFQQCPSAAFIRRSVASLLTDVSKVKAWPGFNPVTKRNEKRQVRRFYYADKVPCDSPVVNDLPDINVVDLKRK